MQSFYSPFAWRRFWKLKVATCYLFAVNQPVKPSDELVSDARLAGAQIERLQQRAAMPLSEILRTVEGPEGRARLEAVLESLPFPRFKAHPTLAQTFIREEEDGRRITGRFHRGKFEPLTAT
jgi:hypothetical protein